MKIVHVLTRFLRAGSEENTVATSLWQAAQGHDVVIVHGCDYDRSWYRELDGQVEIRAMPDLVHALSPVQDAIAIYRFRNLLRELRPDVVHTHQSKAGIVGRAAAIGLPGVLVVHGLHIVNFDVDSRWKRAFYIAVERLSARWTDCFIAVSQSVADRYSEIGVCTSDNTDVVYSGMDLERFASAVPPDDYDTLLGPGFVGNNRPSVVLMLAAFEPRKRHVPFLEALAERRTRFPEFRLLLAGTGPTEDEAMQLAQRLELDDVVVFCGHRPDPERLVAGADVCVLTSDREGLPRVAVQALAGGKPFVATELPGLTEILTDGRNAIVTGPDVMEAVQALAEVLSDAKSRERLASGARNTDLSRWSLEALGRCTTEIYVDAMKTRQVVRPIRQWFARN
ncbi:glycosyltransferase [Tropicimonas marinistellae]|uniref:glycosyltransferase n=1 Tax=Tropicimonas marinistellae TaxID=1739787 RepID=UPI00082D07F6|nr:glycosyltransferase [Tropicimonas marinistellae]